MRSRYQGGPLDGQSVESARPAAYRHEDGRRMSKADGHERTKAGAYHRGDADGYKLDATQQIYLHIPVYLAALRGNAIRQRLAHIEEHPEDREAYEDDIRFIRSRGKVA